MSYIDRLRAARNSPITIYDSYIRDEARSSNGVHTFLEGKTDKPFYDVHLIKHFGTERPIYYYIADNRNGVLSVYQRLKSRAQRNPKSLRLFIVDKDLNDFSGIMPNSNEVYVTSLYSFENYLIDPNGLSRLWDSGINLANTGISKESIGRKFKYTLLRFYVFMRKVFSYVVYKRKKGENAILQNIKMNQIVSIDENLSIKFSNQAYALAISQCALPLPNHRHKAGIAKAEAILRPLDPKKYIRGKFELFILRVFLEKLLALGKGLDNNFSFAFDNNDKGLINYLSPRITTPNDFLEYLHTMENGREET